MGAWVLISASWYESPFCAGRLLVNRNDGAVDEGVLEIGVASHRIEKRLENARLRPSAEAPELGVPVAESRWQVTPGGPGANPPEHGLRKKPIVLRRCTRIAGFPWQIRLKSLPQPIRHHKPLLVHSNLHFGSLNQKSNPRGILIVHRPQKIVQYRIFQKILHAWHSAAHCHAIGHGPAAPWWNRVRTAATRIAAYRDPPARADINGDCE
jgi:hypothetical protein